jgi:Na+/H+-dicarboxylate symporter
MRGLSWGVAAIWSLICWGAYGILSLIAWILATIGLSSIPVIGWLIGFVLGLGVWIIVLVWLIGLAFILLVRRS